MFWLLICAANAQTFNKRYGLNSSLDYSINCRGATIVDESIFIELSELTLDGRLPRIYQMDFEGNLINHWEYDFDDGGMTIGWADYIQPLPGSKLILGNTYYRFADSLRYGSLAKVDADGNMLWQKIYGDSIHDHIFQQVKVTNDNGFIAVGSAALIEGHPKIYVVKTDSIGNEEWHSYLGTSNKYRQGVWIDPLLDGSGYVVSGFEDVTEYDPAGVIYRLNLDGGLIDWHKYDDWGNFDDQGVEAIISCPDGGYAFTTRFNVEETGFLEYTSFPQLVRIDENLDTLWTCPLSEVSITSSAQVVYQTDQGDFITVGTKIRSGEDAKSEGHISKVSSNGDLIWHRIYHYAEFGDNLLFDVDPFPDGRLLCTGWMLGMPAFGDSIPDEDAWLLAVDSMGCLVPGCHLLGLESSLNNPIDMSVYPNPCDNEINIAFDINQSICDAKIIVLDANGKTLKQIEVDHLNATYSISCANLANGNYFLSIQTENGSKCKPFNVSHE